ncbi:PP2C family protein-serine/threonine phosphatase [Deltaproteobacteria bacterium TL4]
MNKILRKEQKNEERKRNERALQESYQIIKHQQAQLDAELEQAKMTQKVLFPEKPPVFHKTQVVCKYIPIQQLGGDFYDVFEVEKDKLGIMVGDVTGHGISAALLSFMIAITFKNNAYGMPLPEAVIRMTNGMLEGKLPAGMFATMFYGIYDSSNQTLTYTSAAHPPGMVIRPQTQEIFPLKTKGMVVGLLSRKIVNYEEKTFQLLAGDKVLLYTDGILEVLGKQDQRMGIEGLEQFLKTYCDLALTALIDQFYEYALAYSNNGFSDDITLVGLEVLA